MKHFILCALTAVSVLIPAIQVSGQDYIVSSGNLSLAVSAPEGGRLEFLYFGPAAGPEDIDMLRESGALYGKSAYPEFGVDNVTGVKALAVKHRDGNLTTDLVVEDVLQDSKPEYDLLKVRLKDRYYDFHVSVFYKGWKNSDVIETWTEFENLEKKPVTLIRFDSGCLYMRRGDVWVSHFSGNWADEARLTEEPLNPGMLVIKNMDGSRNAHFSHAEIMFSLDGKPQENHGRTIGAALCWSGNYELRVSTHDNVNHLFTAGISPDMSQYTIDSGKRFITPPLALSYSDEGLGGVSRNFHRWARNGMIHNGWGTRDILLNSWEGVYFNVTEPGMKQMMEDIASMGGELFVMDDGWFGEKYPRNNDRTSLGDWKADPAKLPDGLESLTDAASENGIKFGIWVEPESVSRISELFEKHPDWALQVKNRDLIFGRGGTQLLLDLCNPEVRDYAFNVIDTLLVRYPGIAYIKWDANVSLWNYGSTWLPDDRQSHIYIDYHRGLESLIKRIREAHPDVVIQSCGGGGGRANYGVMPGYDEFWVSDNTDALQRIFIQWGTSYFYPSNAMAQHVSADRNHQTGRVLPLKFRFDVAMTGRLGMEIQPSDMSAADRKFAAEAISGYKEIRSLVQTGNLYRLVSPYEGKGVCSLSYIDDSRDNAVLFAYKLEHFRNQTVPMFRMCGLDPEKVYRFRELTVPDGESPSSLDGKAISGRILMETGIAIPLETEYASRVYVLTAE